MSGPIRIMLVDDGAQAFAQHAEALREIGFRVGIDDAMRHPRQARPIGGDDAPAGVPEARVDAEYPNHVAHSGRIAGRTD